MLFIIQNNVKTSTGDIPEELKHEIEGLQEKVHRSVGPEDFVATEELLKRIGFDLNWDDIGRRSDMQNALEIKKTREAANASQDYLKEFAKNRNRAAHSGSGGKTITDQDVEKAITFSRVFAKALCELLAARLRKTVARG